MRTPNFIYFDLGKVLVDFDINRMYRQLAEVAGVDSAKVVEVMLGDHVQSDYELGRISSRQFYETFCQRTGARPDYDELLWAGSDIFEPNTSIFPVVGNLRDAGHRMGILSNTCQSHWEYCAKRFWILHRDRTFQTYVLSYRIHAAKPAPKIFQAATELAGVGPQEILFIDDVPEHVTSARAVGFDAVQYTSTPELVSELCERGLRFNY